MTDTSGWDAVDIGKSMRSKGRLLPLVLVQASMNNNAASTSRDTDYLHPSEICKRDWCPRSSMYTIYKTTPDKVKDFSFQTLNIFKTGHDIHDKWQDWLQQIGILEERELPLFSEEYHIKGNADGLVNDFLGKAILEIKSVGLGTVRFEDYKLYNMYDNKEITHDEVWKRIRQPFTTHLKQVMLYMFVTGVHKGIVLYEWKANQAVKEFEVSYQEVLIESILKSCLLVKESLKNNILIDRPEWASSSSHAVCKKCQYNKTCWSNNETNKNDNNGTKSSDGNIPIKISDSAKTDGSISRDTEQPRRLIR